MTSKERILEALNDAQYATKQDLADLTGLSYKYVARLVNELLYEGKLNLVDTEPNGQQVFGALSVTAKTGLDEDVELVK